MRKVLFEILYKSVTNINEALCYFQVKYYENFNILHIYGKFISVRSNILAAIIHFQDVNG